MLILEEVEQQVGGVPGLVALDRRFVYRLQVAQVRVGGPEQADAVDLALVNGGSGVVSVVSIHGEYDRRGCRFIQGENEIR